MKETLLVMLNALGIGLVIMVVGALLFLLLTMLLITLHEVFGMGIIVVVIAWLIVSAFVYRSMRS